MRFVAIDELLKRIRNIAQGPYAASNTENDGTDPVCGQATN